MVEQPWQTRKGRTHHRTDCLDCGAEPDPNVTAAAQRMWARRHVIKHPDHQVHVECTSLRIYIGTS